MNCPKHPEVKLLESKRGKGWFCPAKNEKTGKYCTFTTQVENDTKTWPVDPVISQKVETFTCPACRQKLRVYGEV